MRFAWIFSLAAFFALFACAPVHAARIKDLADVEGVRDNVLVGYGLVVGLQGTGDSLRNSPFTRASLKAMLERLGVSTKESELNTRNIAAVMVTAKLHAFATNGGRIDVQVSAMGDAKNLTGGQLLATPLIGADGLVYAVAQGPIALAGFEASGASGSSVKQGTTTVGRVANGGLVEREIAFDLTKMTKLRLALRNPDFTTARRMAYAINTFTGSTNARATNPATVEVTLTPGSAEDIVGLLTDIEQLSVEPDSAARILIDETSGVVVMSDSVRVSTVAIAQGNLTITIGETPLVSQPEGFSEGETIVVPRTDIQVEEERNGLVIMKEGVRLRDLVDGLNALGVTPRDLISILQALKAAGAIQAEIVTM